MAGERREEVDEHTTTWVRCGLELTGPLGRSPLRFVGVLLGSIWQGNGFLDGGSTEFSNLPTPSYILHLLYLLPKQNLNSSQVLDPKRKDPKMDGGASSPEETGEEEAVM